MAKKPKKTGWYQEWQAQSDVLAKLGLKYDRSIVPYWYHYIGTNARSKFRRQFSSYAKMQHTQKLMDLFLEKNPGVKVHIHCEPNRYSLDLIHLDGTKVALSMEEKLHKAIFWGICNYYGLNKSMYFVNYI